MKITKEQIKETLKLVMKEEADYKVFFKKALEKAGKSIPSMSDDEKKAFFNKIDAAWDAKGEQNEGNAFGAAVVAAKKAGKDEFEVGGEKFKVEESHSDCNCGCGGCSTNLTEGKHDVMLDKLADMVKDAKSFMDIGRELKKNGIKYSFSTSMLPMYLIDKPTKIAILNKKYADGAERIVGSTAIGLMESVVNEASKEAIGIAALTGTRGSAVDDFINKHELDGKKLFNSIKKANLRGRLNFVSALAGKDGNPNQKLTIKLHKQKFNEELSKELAFEVITFMERPVMESIIVDEFEVSDVVEMLVNEGIEDVLTEDVKAEFNTLVEAYTKK
jgi:hypothetical protein